jgi:hypothetical protein
MNTAHTPYMSKSASFYPAKSEPLASSSLSPMKLLIRILRYASIQTLGRCLRVSRLFFSIAGPILYQHIILDSPVSYKLLMGSTILVGDERKIIRSPLFRYTQTITWTPHTSTSHSNEPLAINSRYLPALKTIYINMSTLPQNPEYQTYPSDILAGYQGHTVIFYGFSPTSPQLPHLIHPFFSRIFVGASSITIVLELHRMVDTLEAFWKLNKRQWPPKGVVHIRYLFNLPRKYLPFYEPDNKCITRSEVLIALASLVAKDRGIHTIYFLRNFTQADGTIIPLEGLEAWMRQIAKRFNDRVKEDSIFVRGPEAYLAKGRTDELDQDTLRDLRNQIQPSATRRPLSSKGYRYVSVQYTMCFVRLIW